MRAGLVYTVHQLYFQSAYSPNLSNYSLCQHSQILYKYIFVIKNDNNINPETYQEIFKKILSS